MANEVVNKIAQVEARRRPGCRVLAPNWGPWDGGMVTPALKKLFEEEHIGLIPLRAGAEYLVNELARAADGSVEIVVLGKPSSAPEPTPLVCVLERDLSVQELPVLRSHVLDGRAVVPLAFSVNWLAHGALHGNPDLMFHGFNNLRVLRGIRLGADERMRIQLCAGKAARHGDRFQVSAELRGPSRDGKDVVFTRAEIVLAEKLSAASPALREPSIAAYERNLDEVYDSLLFHGPDLRAIDAIHGCGPQGIVATVRTAPAPAAWVRQPLRSQWLADPLALDAAFQLLVIWSQENLGVPALPCFVGRFEQYRRSFPADGIRVVAAIVESNEHRSVANCEFRDRQGTVLARMEYCECVADPSLREAFRCNRLEGEPFSTVGRA
jgi:hypothetical protein